jgi:glycosyltransferase involved in cell wall biosynthesis
MEKVILFGLGGKYKYERKHNPSLFEELCVVAFSDNNESTWGTIVDGKPVILPTEIVNTKCDRVVVLSNYYKSIVNKLIKLGVPEGKIIHWDEFVVLNSHGYKKEYPSLLTNKSVKEVLMISTSLEINGGTNALINAGIALDKNEYSVTICGPDADNSVIEYINNGGLNVVIAPAIQYPNEKDIEWVKKYDYILVNTFQMLRTACLISVVRPIFWWIHENSEKYSDIYQRVRSINHKYKVEDYSNIIVCPVTKKAAKIFNDHYPSIETTVLPLGVSDSYNCVRNNMTEEIKIAIIGSIELRKNQLFAIETLSEYGNNIELLIAGKVNDDDYSLKVKKLSREYSNIELLGEMSSDEVKNLYHDIDIVLCPSLEETLSMTIIEGMMNKKLVITSDATGIADYIVDGENGFVFKSGDADSLREKIDIILGEKADLEKIRENARKTYLDNFTLEKVGERFEKMFEKMSYKGKE